MGLQDKITNAAEEAIGKVKEKLGDSTGNEDLQAEGATQQTEANVKQTGENIKDVFK